MARHHRILAYSTKGMLRMLFSFGRFFLGNPRYPISICLAWLLLFGGALPAGAYTAQQILQPYEDDIQLCREANAAIHLQAMRRRHELDSQVKQLVADLQSGLGPNKVRLREEWDRRSKVDQAMRSGFGHLIYDPRQPRNQQKAHVPHFGWLDHNSLKQRHDQYIAQLRKEQTAVNRQEMSLWVVTLGFVTEKDLRARIAAKQKELAEFKKLVYRGEFKIHFPGMGWVSHSQLRQRMASNEKKIAEVRAQIQQGQYKVFLPHLGWVTRNDVLARIKKVDEAMADVNKRFSRKQAKVFRHYLGWTDQNALQASINQITKTALDFDRAVGQGAFRANLAGLGWTSGKELDAQIRQSQQGLDKVKGMLSAGSYQVPVLGFGFMNRNQIRQRLRQPGLNKQQIAALQKGLVHIGEAGKVDMAVRTATLIKLRALRNRIAEHAMPRKKALLYDKSRRQQYYNEAFSDERRDILRRLQRQKAFLQQSLGLIPWKLPPLPPKKPLQLIKSM